MKRIMSILLALSTTACLPAPEYHAGPHELLQQYAPLNGAALRVCCGQLRHCMPHQSPRC